MIFDILYALWLFLPAGVSNAAPIIASRLPLIKNWNYPLDCNRTFRGKPLLGKNKTWRGVLFGTLMATIVFLLQQKVALELGAFSTYLGLQGYTDFPAVLGTLLGFGALAGDAIASFFKRQKNIAPGKSWIPFDQVDYIIGSCVCAALIVVLPLHMYFWIFLLWFLAHVIFSYIGYRLGLKRNPI